MGKVTGFLEEERETASYRPIEERLEDYRQVENRADPVVIKEQAARCMDCGVPFCHPACPLGNIIPDFNDLGFRDKWEDASARLHSTNNFPEFTGTVCPAICEQACVLGISDDPVTIKNIELEIAERAFENGWVKAVMPERRTGRSVAIVGSGPAGLSAAQQLCRAGHSVTVFEKSDRIGGLLRYGIPDFKMEKHLIDRRLEQMREEGVSFQAGVNVGQDLSIADLRKNFDAILLSTGSEQPRDLPVPGRELAGVHFAMEFLPQQNHRVAGDKVDPVVSITAKGKHVIVLGGGDTGSDCVGTSLRQGAKSVTSLELLERPPDSRADSTPWPLWPHMFRSSSSHDEGGERLYTMLTKSFEGREGKVEKLNGVKVGFGAPDASGRPTMAELPGSEFELKADLVLLAMGFLHPVHDGLISQLGVELDARGNVFANTSDFVSSEPGVFSAGDCRRGQSLVVWAQWEGREVARAVDAYLMGRSALQARDSLF